MEMFRNMPPVTRALFIVNVLVFLITLFVGQNAVAPFALYPLDLHHQLSEQYRFQPWQLITYAFMHGGFGHLALNMLALVMFGSSLESYWGSRRYAIFYFVSAIGAALLQTAASEWALQNDGSVAAVVGASGAIFGLLVGYGMHFPTRRVMLLFPPIPMKARTLVIAIGVAETVFGLMGWLPGIAHFAHLGGFIAGYLMCKFWLRPNPYVR